MVKKLVLMFISMESYLPGSCSNSIFTIRAVILIMFHLLEVIMVPSECQIALSMGRHDAFLDEMLTSGFALQSSKVHRTSAGNLAGLVAD